ncbi:Uncharacterised protein [Escherichia coli]|nr:Uncharacterised protein [Escherichia coli]
MPKKPFMKATQGTAGMKKMLLLFLILNRSLPINSQMSKP